VAAFCQKLCSVIIVPVCVSTEI